MGGPLTSNEQISKVIKSPPAQNTWLEIKTAFTKFYPTTRTEVALRNMKLNWKAEVLRMCIISSKNGLHTLLATKIPFPNNNNNKKSSLRFIRKITKKNTNAFDLKN